MVKPELAGETPALPGNAPRAGGGKTAVADRPLNGYGRCPKTARMTTPADPSETPSAVPAASGPPPVHPDHEVLRLIGRGGGGQVWLARTPWAPAAPWRLCRTPVSRGRGTSATGAVGGTLSEYQLCMQTVATGAIVFLRLLVSVRALLPSCNRETGSNFENAVKFAGRRSLQGLALQHDFDGAAVPGYSSQARPDRCCRCQWGRAFVVRNDRRRPRGGRHSGRRSFESGGVVMSAVSGNVHNRSVDGWQRPALPFGPQPSRVTPSLAGAIPGSLRRLASELRFCHFFPMHGFPF